MTNQAEARVHQVCNTAAQVLPHLTVEVPFHPAGVTAEKNERNYSAVMKAVPLHAQTPLLHISVAEHAAPGGTHVIPPTQHPAEGGQDVALHTQTPLLQA